MDAISLHSGHYKRVIQLAYHFINQLNCMIERAQKEKEKPRVVPTFYMASYLLDVICASNIFGGLNLNWHISKLLVHVYFQILWDNKYKRSYSTICDFFLAPLYKIIFYRECPRLTKDAKKLISYIGNWYLQEDLTYLRICGATATPHLFPKYVPDRIVLGEITYQDNPSRFQCFIVERGKEKYFYSLWF
jgi:hypothetical protein